MNLNSLLSTLCRSILLGASLVGAAASTASAATLVPNGIVLINRGNGFEVVRQPINTLPTDRVLVNSGSAQISYTDGSVANLKPGNLYTVGQSNTPTPGSQTSNLATVQTQVQTTANPTQGRWPGQGGGQAPSNGPMQGPIETGNPPVHGATQGPPAGGGGLPTYALIGGGVAIAGGAVLLSNISKEAAKPAKPSSP
jgi:hypothetical protein